MLEIELMKNGSVVRKELYATEEDLIGVLRGFSNSAVHLADNMIFFLNLLGDFYTHREKISSGDVFEITIKQL